MELEDLKSLWQQNKPAYQAKNEEEIALMLKGKSKSIIDKLKRNVWIELMITIASGIGLLIYGLKVPNGAFKWTTIALLLMCIAYTFFYVKKLVMLQRHPLTNDNLNITLTILIKNLSGYLKFYRRSYAILYPGYFILGFSFSIIEHGPSNILHYLSRWTTLLTIFILATLFFFFSAKLVKWYLNKLYGNHLERLKALHQELQSYQSPV